MKSDTNLFVNGIRFDRERVSDFTTYPFALPAIVRLKQLTFEQPVTFFIGENGSGKSTLLEAMAIALGYNAEGGSKNFQFATRASHSELHQFLHPVRSLKRPRDGFFFRAESYYNVATEIERLDEEGMGPRVADSYGDRPLHAQSHGESFLALVMNRFHGGGLYLMDEPEAALSPMRQMTLISRMHELVRKGSQFIVATHSPILLAYPKATIFEFGASGPQLRRYEETEHFRVTHDFLTRYPAMLRVLMGSETEEADSE